MLSLIFHKNNVLLLTPLQEVHNHHGRPSSDTSLTTTAGSAKLSSHQGQRKGCAPEGGQMLPRAVLKRGARHLLRNLLTVANQKSVCILSAKQECPPPRGTECSLLCPEGPEKGSRSDDKSPGSSPALPLFTKQTHHWSPQRQNTHQRTLKSCVSISNYFRAWRDREGLQDTISQFQKSSFAFGRDF